MAEEQAKHTPGPWRRYGGGKRRWGITRDGVGGSICQMTRTDDEAANARLIADAPAMRLALDAVAAGVARVEGWEFCFGGMRYSVRDGDWSGSFTTFGLWDKLPAAISKAKGGVA